MSRNGLIVDIETCHKDGEIPEYQNEGDAGMDLKAVEKIKDTGTRLWFKTGLKISIPEEYVGLIYPRSSITEKQLELGNSVGVIDSGYRGEIEVRFNKIPGFTNTDVYGPGSYFGQRGIDGAHEDFYEVGDRVAQLVIMPYPHIQFNKVDDLEDTERGSDGFGSTGD